MEACEDGEKSKQHILLGTWWITCILVMIFSFIILIWLIHKIFWKRDIPPTILHIPLFIYFLFLCFTGTLGVFLYLPLFLSHKNGLDRSRLSCIMERLTAIGPLGFYSSMLWFWFLRLNIVFPNGSVYKITKTFKYIFYFWWIIASLIGISALIYLITQKTNCLYSIKIIDFLPFQSGNDHQEYFFFCFGGSAFAEGSMAICAAVTVSGLNLLMSYAYISKFYQIIRHLEISSLDDRMTKDTYFRFKRVIIIALVSILTTTIALGLWNASLIGIWLSIVDGFINGLLMLATFEFGEWMCDCCLRRNIDIVEDQKL